MPFNIAHAHLIEQADVKRVLPDYKAQEYKTLAAYRFDQARVTARICKQNSKLDPEVAPQYSVKCGDFELFYFLEQIHRLKEAWLLTYYTPPARLIEREVPVVEP